MIELMPVSCCVTLTPIPTKTMRRSHLFARIALKLELIAFLLVLGDLLHLSELREGPVLGAHRLQHGERLVIAALLDEPARRLGHPQHAEEQGDRGQRADCRT